MRDVPWRAVRAGDEFEAAGGGAMTKIKLRTGTFKHVESELYHYHETKKEIAKLKEFIIHATPPPDRTGGGRSNWPSDPTGRSGTMLVTNRKIEQMERIIDAIDDVYIRLPKEKQKLVRLKYWTKPQKLTWDGIALELDVSRRTAINWRDEIVYAIAELLGWR